MCMWHALAVVLHGVRPSFAPCAACLLADPAHLLASIHYHCSSVALLIGFCDHTNIRYPSPQTQPALFCCKKNKNQLDHALAPWCATVNKLDDLGVLDNTYIILTSDNGFHLGQHCMQYEKFTTYEEDVRVPFFIRGPKVPVGVKSAYQATMVDLPATILTLAGGPLKSRMDGVPFPFEDIDSGAAGPVMYRAPRLAPPPPENPEQPPVPRPSPRRSPPRRRPPPASLKRSTDGDDSASVVESRLMQEVDLGTFFDPAAPVPPAVTAIRDT